MIVALDCHELTKDKPNSIGLIEERIIVALKDEKLLLLSDIPLKEKYLNSNSENIVYGKKVDKGFDIVKYQNWQKMALESRKNRKIAFYYQLNQFFIFRIRGIKVITTILDLYWAEGYDNFSAFYRFMRRIFTNRTLRFSHTVTAISQYTKERLHHFIKTERDIKVIYVGIDEPTINIDTTPMVEGKYLLCLGRLTHWKGQKRLLELYERYFEDSDYKLVFAGKADDSDVQDAVTEACSRNPNIIWYDYVTNEQRENLYRNCSLFCYPSVYDGFGMPPLEAAKRNVKCLMNDIPVLREVTQNMGYYIDYYGVDATVVAEMKRLLETEDMGTIEALFQVASSYTWQNYVNCLIQFAGENNE